jgi:hypothetical protein
VANSIEGMAFYKQRSDVGAGSSRHCRQKSMVGAKPHRTQGRRLGEQPVPAWLPNPARFVGEHGALDQEHFTQVTQAQLVAQPPEEEHDVARDLNPVQRRASPLGVPPPALPAAEAPEAMNRSPRPLGGRGGMAQSMVALLISQNGPENIFANASPGKLPRDLTEPAQKYALEEPRAGAPDKASADCNQPQEISPSPTSTWSAWEPIRKVRASIIASADIVPARNSPSGGNWKRFTAPRNLCLHAFIKRTEIILLYRKAISGEVKALSPVRNTGRPDQYGGADSDRQQIRCRTRAAVTLNQSRVNQTSCTAK